MSAADRAFFAEAIMTDVTKDWAGGAPLRQTDDPTTPAASTSGLTPDTGGRTPPAAAAAAETRSFGDDGKDAPKSRPAPRNAKTVPPEAISDEESLLRASLETIRVKAEDLRGQARDWAQIRREQALQAIDERPITAIAAAFGAGLVLGALLSR